METYSSGEELIIKIRKPYTITRQRERWTEQEHNRFLEALKLYGRAWQRIEEHIGTKTAVQIRSHAQKFFTKLQKEALVKGIPIGQALDIEIPPPRPKRKPSNPYPRKMSIDTHTSQVGSKDGKSGNPTTSLPKAARILDLEKEPLPEYQKPGDEKFGNSNETQDEDKSPTSFILVQSSPGISQSSENKSSLLTSVAPEKLCVFKEFVPILNEVDNKDETNESYVTLEPGENKNSDKFDTKQSFEENGTCNGANLVKSHPLDEKMAQKLENECSQSENFETWPENDVRSAQSQPKHVAVHILDGSLRMNMPNISPHIPFQESMFHQIDGVHPNVFMNLSPSATSENHGNASRFSINQPFAGFHPIFTPVQNQDNYQSFLHASSTFSNLFVSALLQNPAAHAAASSAASFWPCSSTEASADSPGGTTGGFIARQINAAPNMAAIATATVAAATAWWTANGLLPLCAPFHRSFNYVPASASTVPVGTDQTRADVIERREESGNPALDAQQLKPEFSEAKQHSTSKSPTLSFLDSGESNGLKSNNGLTAIETEQAAAVTELRDSNKLKGRKQVDRSSCGSNTPSSSEVETDALEKHEKDMEESREPALSHPTDASGRRSRSSSSISDSWKEVSEVGRLAFRALFSRGVLPQSFSPPYDSNNKGKNNNEKDTQNADEKGDEGSQLDLNVMTWPNRSSNQEVEDNAIFRSLSIKEDGLLTMGKLKSCRTGFKPYKRCSMEAKESRVASAASQDEEKGAKRMRLEGQASVH